MAFARQYEAVAEVAVILRETQPGRVAHAKHFVLPERLGHAGPCVVADHPPGEEREFKIRVRPPSVAGDFVLRVTLVQEFVAWFDDLHEDNYCDCPLSVVAPATYPSSDSADVAHAGAMPANAI